MQAVFLGWSKWASESRVYQATKTFVREMLADTSSKKRVIFDTMMMLLVIVSVLVMVLDIQYHFGLWVLYFEWTTISIFSLEYLMRLWICSDLHRIGLAQYETAKLARTPVGWGKVVVDWLSAKWRFIKSPLAIIDLLAIIPLYRPLRILRLFLLFRLFKIFRYSRTLRSFSSVFSEKKFELRLIFLLMLLVIGISGIALYIFEGKLPGSKVDNLFDAFYWALITISTVGYGDITPATIEGKIVTMILILCGVGLIAFFTSTLVSAFNNQRTYIQRVRLFSELEKQQSFVLMCGFGRIGESLAEQLKEIGTKLVVIDQDPLKVERARALGLHAIACDASDIEMLNKMSVGAKASTVLCLTNSDVTNLYITLSIRQLNPDTSILVRLNDQQNRDKMLTAGATRVISPYQVVATIGREFAGQPVAFEVIRNIANGNIKSGIETIPITDDSKLSGVAIKDLALPDAGLVLLGVLQPAVEDNKHHYKVGNARFRFNPTESFCLQSGDTLVVIGNYQSAQHFILNYC